MTLAVTLDDKYVLETGRVYLTGTQALVRLPMMQRQRDLGKGQRDTVSEFPGRPFPMQNWLTGRFRAAAGEQNLGELQSLWMGQAAPLARGTTAADVFAELAAGVPGR